MMLISRKFIQQTIHPQNIRRISNQVLAAHNYIAIRQKQVNWSIKSVASTVFDSKNYFVSLSFFNYENFLKLCILDNEPTSTQRQ